SRIRSRRLCSSVGNGQSCSRPLSSVVRTGGLKSINAIPFRHPVEGAISTEPAVRRAVIQAATVAAVVGAVKTDGRAQSWVSAYAAGQLPPRRRRAIAIEDTRGAEQ